MDTSSIINYMLARMVNGTAIVNASANDPVLIQAQEDGYADRVNGQWIARGAIKSGERRILRHSWQAGGGTKEIIG